MSQLDKMIEFFDSYQFNEHELRLNHFTKINNVKKFVYTNIGYLKGNGGKKLFLPYFERLNQVYTLINKNKNKYLD